MTHKERQDLIRRKFALETRLGSMTVAQLRAATGDRLSASFNIPINEATAILRRECSRRRV